MTRARSTILVLSSVLPAPTSAGEIILHRHLSQAGDWEVSVVEDRRRGSQFSLATRIIKRFYRTRLHRWAGSLDVLAWGRQWNAILPVAAGQKAIVLTVAHGDGCWAARRFAKKHGFPLATIFHDWWPDVPAVHAPLRRLLDARFARLYEESDLALCVSEGMKGALGPHPNSVVLHPIPGVPKRELASGLELAAGALRPMKVHYSGNLHEYGSMLGGLLQASEAHPGLRVHVRGPNPNWPAAFREEMQARGLWLDFAPRAELDAWLSSADALVVVMSFAPAMRRRMETSFPSKLTEYSQVGKPLVIWGPAYCSAVRWARHGDRALCVMEEDPQALVAALEELFRSPERRAAYAQKAREAAAGEFNPARLQRQFLAAIGELIGRGSGALERRPERL